MMKFNKLLIALALAASCSLALSSCQSASSDINPFSNYEAIAEYSVMECYYHNVAEFKNDGTDYLFGIVNIGFKKAWFEYRGSVRIGIDINELEVSKPDQNGVVTIKIPEAKVLGIPKVDIDSISELYFDTGLISPITNEDKQEAFSAAQENMKQEAEADTGLKKQADKRARILLEQYVIRVGKAQGKDYKVQFESI